MLRSTYHNYGILQFFAGKARLAADRVLTVAGGENLTIATARAVRALSGGKAAGQDPTQCPSSGMPGAKTGSGRSSEVAPKAAFAVLAVGTV